MGRSVKDFSGEEARQYAAVLFHMEDLSTISKNADIKGHAKFVAAKMKDVLSTSQHPQHGDQQYSSPDSHKGSSMPVSSASLPGSPDDLSKLCFHMDTTARNEKLTTGIAVGPVKAFSHCEDINLERWRGWQ